MGVHHKFSKLLALRDMTCNLYDKVQGEVKVPKLERKLEKAREMWGTLERDKAI